MATNPLLTPTKNWWESAAVFNPGVAEDPNGSIHILYRAMGTDGISRFGYARTEDGETIVERSAEPVLEPADYDDHEARGIEDPRITRIDDTFYILYTAASLYRDQDARPGWIPSMDLPWRTRVALAMTKDFRTFTHAGIVLPHMDNKDAVVFPEPVNGRYVMLHRLPPDIWMAHSTDLRTWEGHHSLLRTRPAHWDERKLGAGTPPVKTPSGWLLLYHGSDHHNVYRAGFLLLDLNDPSKVLGRSNLPVLQPETPEEREGLVPNVVFPTGLILRGDTLFVYYGGADKVVCGATIPLADALNALRSPDA